MYNLSAIQAYNSGSHSARALSNNLGIPILRERGSTFRGNLNRVIINWGESEIQNREVLRSTILNSPQNVTVASNKLSFFQRMSNQLESLRPRTVPWTVLRATAQTWLDDGYTVVIRRLLRSHSGQGILLADPGGTSLSSYPRAQLYTKYKKKRDEYRIHFMRINNEIRLIWTQKKLINRERLDTIRRNFEGAELRTVMRIRNHHNGFIYSTQINDVPPDVHFQASQAARTSNLDFGAVDILWNQNEELAYVLEINTAPGLEGSSIETYTTNFINLVDSFNHMEEEEQPNNIPDDDDPPPPSWDD